MTITDAADVEALDIMELFSVMSLAVWRCSICAQDELWTCAIGVQLDTRRCGVRKRSRDVHVLPCRQRAGFAVPTHSKKELEGSKGSSHTSIVTLVLSVAQMGALPHFVFQHVSYAWSWHFAKQCLRR